MDENSLIKSLKHVTAEYFDGRLSAEDYRFQVMNVVSFKPWSHREWIRFADAIEKIPDEDLS